jgi:hypothetical protein
VVTEMVLERCLSCQQAGSGSVWMTLAATAASCHALVEVKALLAYLLCVSSGEPIPIKAEAHVKVTMHGRGWVAVR